MQLYKSNPNMSPKTRIVTNPNNILYYDYYVISCPTPREPNFYRQMKSFHCFEMREITKCLKHPNSKHCLVLDPICRKTPNSTLEEIYEFLEKYLFVDTKLVIHCNDVYDFYEKIGYDRKKKKYVN